MTADQRPRVGVVNWTFGSPSEVWMLRQITEFTRITPVLFTWRIISGGAPIPPGVEVHMFDTPFAFAPTIRDRTLARLGLGLTQRPSAAQRADIAGALLGARLDAVLCHFAWTAMRVAPALNGALPVVCQCHGRDVSVQLQWAGYRKALAATLPQLDHVVTVGSFQAPRLRALSPTPPITVNPCGAPVALFGRGPLPERAPGAPIRFLSVGRHSHEKGVLESLRAFEIVAETDPLAEMVFVGDGPQGAALRAAVAASPAAARIRVAGVLAQEAVAAEMRAAHVLLQHSREVDGWVEGFGVTVAEGGATGLPIVASRTGGIVDQIEDGVNGFLFDPDDVVAQAAAMRRLAADEPARRRMGAAARRMAMDFDSARLTARLEDVVLNAIARRRAAA